MTTVATIIPAAVIPIYATNNNVNVNTQTMTHRNWISVSDVISS